MKVVLFRTFPDSYRQSMEVYASSLEGALKSLFPPTEEVVSCRPEKPMLAPRLARYWCQYILYPIQAQRAQGDVNHIIDHAYGHLLHHLEHQRSVVTVHDLNLWERGPRFIRRYTLSGVKLAAQVICDSETTRKAFLKFSGYPPEQASVIYDGVEETFFKHLPETSGKPSGMPDGQYILHVGHTQAYKNIPSLFHTLSLLIHSFKLNVRLLKVGEAFTPEQKKLAENLGVADRVIHLGIVPRERLPEIYRRADLFLFPSLNEGFGLPVLEAMASGIPVIASNRGALPEIVGEAGILVDPEDYRTMSQAAASLLEQPSLRRRLAKEGQKRAGLFTWEKTARKTLELYRKIHIDL